MISRISPIYLLLITMLLSSCMLDSGGNRSSRKTSGGQNLLNYDVNLFSESTCICRSGLPLNSSTTCNQVCQENPTSTDTLFSTAILSDSVKNNEELGTLFNWCKKERELPEGIILTNPECFLQAQDSQGRVTQLDMVLDQNLSSFRADAQNLRADETYIITIVEAVSGMSSNSIQIRKNRSSGNGALGNLFQTGVNRYNCFVNQIAGENFVDGIYRLTFLYSVTPPLAIPAGTEGINCHSNYLNNPFDSPVFPRLELEQNVFSIWSLTDPRFYDNDGDDILDVHNRLGDAVGSQQISIFQQISWDREPVQAQAQNNNGDTEESPLGYLMVPFIYPETHPTDPLKSFCPKNVDYNGNDPLFREIGTLLGVETQGVYVGRREQQTIVDQESGEQVIIPENRILIEEETLKRIWFYLDPNGIHRFPTEENVRNQIVFFYWPAAPVGADPHIQQPSQERYQVVYEVESSAAPTHDKKIGCVPKPQ